MSDTTTDPTAVREEQMLLDVLAYQLYLLSEPGACREIWQKQQETRREFRAKANDYLSNLSNAGVRVDVKKRGALEQSFSLIQTIPAKKAYELGDD